MAGDTRHDYAVRWEIMELIDLDPRLSDGALGVGVQDGVAILTGYVPCGADCLEAEALARRVPGVKKVVVDIVVMPALNDRVRDAQLAKRAVDVLGWFLPGQIDELKVSAAAGWLTLRGVAGHAYVKDDAETLLRRMRGVIAVQNRIEVRGARDPRWARETMRGAIARRAEVKVRSLSAARDRSGRLAVIGDFSVGEQSVARALACAVSDDLEPVGAPV